MIVYLAPGSGRGHATRAAAICRHLTTEHVVLTNPGFNEALDRYQVPYLTADTVEMPGIAAQFHPAYVIGDYNPGTVRFDAVCPSLTVWRLGRRMHHGDIPQLRVEGVGGCWPLSLLEPDEILGRDDARQELGFTPGRRYVVAVPSASAPGIAERFRHDYVLDRHPRPGGWPPPTRSSGSPGTTCGAKSPPPVSPPGGSRWTR